MKPRSSTPLMDGTGRKQVRQVSSATLLGHAVLCVFVPWTFYMALLGMSLFWYNADDLHHSLVVFVFAMCQIGCVLACFLSRRAWVRQLGNMCMVVFLLGVLGCMWNEFEHMVYFRTYSSMRLYTNVQPTVSAVRYLDAGAVFFSGDTSVDKTRGRAFKSFEKPGMTFCVAPIIDSTLTAADEIGFWAVGTNCCAKMATFGCDSANDGSTKSAVVVLPPEEVLPSWVVSMGIGDNHYKDYLQALKLSSATFGTMPAKEVRLMRWIKNPDEFISDFRRMAVGFWFESSIVIFGLLVLTVLYLVSHGLAV